MKITQEETKGGTHHRFSFKYTNLAAHRSKDTQDVRRYLIQR